jgi:hypothetical protein
MTKYTNMKCNYCNKICKNDNSLRNHERLCKLNPNRQVLVSNFIKWNDNVNRGLQRASNQHIKAKETGTVYVVSDETKSKISKATKGRQIPSEEIERRKIAMRKAVLRNPSSYTANNISGRTPIIEYNGFKLKGSWELETAKWLDRNNIKWTNIVKGFDYEWNGSTHIYYPDFYLIEYDRYIEVKGYERDRDRAKWKVVKDLIVLKKEHINKIKNNLFYLNV